MYHEAAGLSAAMADPDRRRQERAPHRRARRPETRVRIMGEAIDLMRPEEVLEEVRGWVEAGGKAICANHNVHSMHLVRVDPAMRAFYDAADLVQVDSRPLILFGRLKGLPIQTRHRSTYLDWREHFWSLAARLGWRVFYLGGAEGVAVEAASRLEQRWPGVGIGVHSGYFDATPGSAGNAAVVEQIRAFGPHILFVGMGMPRQERWIVDNLAALPDGVIFNIGAAFDYEAGVQRAAPRWMGKVGVEWLYRLLNDPKRLFHRYCIEPWRLVGPAIQDLRGR